MLEGLGREGPPRRACRGDQGSNGERAAELSSQGDGCAGAERQ